MHSHLEFMEAYRPIFFMETTPLLGRKDRFGPKQFVQEAKPLGSIELI
jgi:hypothetical protein